MARWENEVFKTQTPPSTIMCTNCKYRMKPVTVAGYTQDRSGYSTCDMYTRKPEPILWDNAPCRYYEKEE